MKAIYRTWAAFSGHKLCDLALLTLTHLRDGEPLVYVLCIETINEQARRS